MKVSRYIRKAKINQQVHVCAAMGAFSCWVPICIGAYKRDVVAVIEIGCMFIFKGCLLTKGAILRYSYTALDQ